MDRNLCIEESYKSSSGRELKLNITKVVTDAVRVAALLCTNSKNGKPRVDVRHAGSALVIQLKNTLGLDISNASKLVSRSLKDYILSRIESVEIKDYTIEQTAKSPDIIAITIAEAHLSLEHISYVSNDRRDLNELFHLYRIPIMYSKQYRNWYLYCYKKWDRAGCRACIMSCDRYHNFVFNRPRESNKRSSRECITGFSDVEQKSKRAHYSSYSSDLSR